jgi:hypothetical protein
MADYKFDGKELRLHGNRVGVLDGKSIRDVHGKPIGRIDGKDFRDGHGALVARFDGKEIRDSHGSKIGTTEDARMEIDGVGGSSLAAMWVFFVK